MKLVVLIASHENPEQLGRLIKTLQHPDINIYVHIDRKSSIDLNSIPGQFRCIRNRTEIIWSSFRQVDLVWNSLVEIFREEGDFDYLAFISGQDYPLYSTARLLTEIEKMNGQEMIGTVPLNNTGWKKAMVRFERYYFGCYSKPVRSAGRLLTFTCDSLRFKRHFPAGLAPYAGSAWWTLSSGCLQFVLHYLETHKKFVSFMKKTLYPDEMIIQTIIMNSPYKDHVTNNNFRYIEWPEIKGNAHPKILTMADFEKIRNSGMHFARKFDIRIDYSILDMIDEKMHYNNGVEPIGG